MNFKRIIAVTLFMLTARVGFATTFYVAKTGSDSNAGTSVSSPKLTINGCVNAMSGGDTCYVRAGTYNEDLSSNTIPSGTGFPAGATTIQGYAGDARPTMVGNIWLSTHNNIIWSGININGINTPVNGSAEESDDIFINGGSNIRITNAEVYNCMRHCILTHDGNAALSNIQFTYLTVHDSGLGTGMDNAFHNFYISAHFQTTGTILLDHVESYNANCAGTHTFAGCWGVQVYSSDPGFLDGVVVSNSYIHDNNEGIVVGSGPNHKVYNNVIYNNAGTNGEAAVTISYGSGVDNIQIYNNTIVANVGYAVETGHYNTPTNTLIKNNIFWQNTNDGINAYSGSGTVSTPNLTSDPLLVSQSSHDFHLTSSSPARGAGTNLSGVFTTDKDGNTRAASGSWDDGAYAFTSVSVPPAPQNLHLLP